MINLFDNIRFGITTPEQKHYLFYVKYVKSHDAYYVHQIRSKDTRYLGKLVKIPYLQIELTSASTLELGDIPLLQLNSILHEMHHNTPLPDGYEIYRK